MNKEYLYDWIFTFNPYTQKYQAVKRENFADLYSENSKVISADTMEKLERKLQTLTISSIGRAILS